MRVSLTGGQVGALIQDVPEMPTIDVGDRYAFAVTWLPERPDPLVLDWRYIAPDEPTPSASWLRAGCDQGNSAAPASR